MLHILECWVFLGTTLQLTSACCPGDGRAAFFALVVIPVCIFMRLAGQCSFLQGREGFLVFLYEDIKFHPERAQLLGQEACSLSSRQLR